MTSHATIRVTSRATCRGIRTRSGGEVVNDEPARGRVVDDEPARGGVVYDEPTRRVVDDERRDEPRDVPRHPDARRRRSCRR
jgi:hypothetical protein